MWMGTEPLRVNQHCQKGSGCGASLHVEVTACYDDTVVQSGLPGVNAAGAFMLPVLIYSHHM